MQYWPHSIRSVGPGRNVCCDAQQSALEVEIVATLAARLLLDYGIAASRLALLAPHRAQNSAIAQRLAQLPAFSVESV